MTLPTLVLCGNPEVYFPGTRRPRCQAAIYQTIGVPKPDWFWRQCKNMAKPGASEFPICGVHAHSERRPKGLVQEVMVKHD